MQFFNEKDEEQEEVPKNREYPRRVFKDLGPQNKAKRKEPVKPWGKTERLVVLITLLVTVFASAFLALFSRGWKLPGLPRLTLPSFNFNSDDNEPLVIKADKGADSESEKLKEKSQKAIETFKKISFKFTGVYGLYVYRLDSKTDYGVNENEVFEPASLKKLPIMVAMFQDSEKGKLNLETKYKLKASDRIGGSGSLVNRPVGTTVTYRELIRYMGHESDNTAFNIAKNLLGKERILKMEKDLGLKYDLVFEDKTTPKEVGLIFSQLYAGKIISDKNRDELLEYLTKTIYEEFLPKGIPSNIRVAHKFGTDGQIVNDGGIVFAGKPFILVILSKEIVNLQAKTAIPEFVQAIFSIEEAN